jgi:hypothetical protein
MFARQHPIKANPAKAGDAKLWVYSHVSDHDRQAAEDHEQRLYLFGLASYSQAFLFGWLVELHKCDPIKSVSQKEQSHVRTC